MILRSDMGVTIVRSAAADADVVRSAKVSTLGAESAEREGESAGLIGYLMRNRHGTPFEHNSMTFLIEAPIFVFREFHRHRAGWSYNEESGRYRELAPVFYLPSADRNLVQSGKAGEYRFGPGTDGQHQVVEDSMAVAYAVAYENYRKMLDAGVAREVARSVLPVGLYSSMYATCNARSLMHFLSLRTKSEQAAVPSFPQREIEMVAEGMEAAWRELMPLTYEAFVKSGRVAP